MIVVYQELQYWAHGWPYGYRKVLWSHFVDCFYEFSSFLEFTNESIPELDAIRLKCSMNSFSKLGVCKERMSCLYNSTLSSSEVSATKKLMFHLDEMFTALKNRNKFIVLCCPNYILHRYMSIYKLHTRKFKPSWWSLWLKTQYCLVFLCLEIQHLLLILHELKVVKLQLKLLLLLFLSLLLYCNVFLLLLLLLVVLCECVVIVRLYLYWTVICTLSLSITNLFTHFSSLLMSLHTWNSVKTFFLQTYECWVGHE